MTAKKTAALKKSPAKKVVKPKAKQVWIGFDPDYAESVLSGASGEIFFRSKDTLKTAYLDALDRNDWVGKIAVAKIDSVVEVVKSAPTLKELDMNVEFKGVV